MKIFHYLAEQLKDVPLFENIDIDIEDVDDGAIYNDFDGDYTKLLEEDDDEEMSFSFSQTTDSNNKSDSGEIGSLRKAK